MRRVPLDLMELSAVDLLATALAGDLLGDLLSLFFMEEPLGSADERRELISYYSKSSDRDILFVAQLRSVLLASQFPKVLWDLDRNTYCSGFVSLSSFLIVERWSRSS